MIQTQLFGILNEVQTVPNDFRERSLPKVEETMKKSAEKCLVTFEIEKFWLKSHLDFSEKSVILMGES